MTKAIKILDPIGSAVYDRVSGAGDYSSSGDVSGYAVDPAIAAREAQLNANATTEVATRDTSGLPPSSRLPRPFEGPTRRLGDTKPKRMVRKELLGD